MADRIERWRDDEPGGRDPREFFANFDFDLRWLILGIGAALLVLGAVTSFYTVEPDEEAVVLRFGRYYATAQPGLNFRMPFGIDRVTKLKTKQILQQEFGFRTEGRGAGRTTYVSREHDEESLMLTGDLNVADVEWVVQYQIADPKKFLFNAASPVRNIRDVSLATIRRVVGDRLVTDVLTVGRAEIAEETRRLMQGILDQYDVGVRIVSVKLQDVNPPEPVKPSFNEVNAAKQEQEREINRAEEEYNRVIPEARGKAQEEISRAEGYAAAAVNRSTGDAERFRTVLEEYRKAPDITRQRLYLETMEELFGRFESVTVVDDEVKGLLPLFDMRGGK